MKPTLLFGPLLILLLIGCGEDDSGTHSFTGIMETTTVRVSSQIQGLITSRPIEEGDTVSAGAILATIETKRLGFQEDQGNALLTELDHQLQSLDRQISGQRSVLANLESRVQRLTALHQSKAVPTQSLDDATAQRDAAREQLRSLESNRAALSSRKEQARSTMNITRSSIQDASVISPTAGTVLVTHAERGEYAMPGSPICDVADLGSMWTMIYVDEPLLSKVRIGQKANIHVDGLTSPMSGTVRWVSPKAEFTPKAILTEDTRTSLVYAVKVAVNNPSGILKIGMPVTVTLTVK